MNQTQLENWMKLRLEQEIALMKEAIDSFTRNTKDPDRLAYQIAECKQRIVNAATSLGDYETAYQYVTESHEATLLVRLAKALAREDDADCRCTVDVTPAPGGLVPLPKLFKWRRVYSKENLAWIDVYKCSKCNFMTANPRAHASAPARRLERERAKPENTNPRKRATDIEVLKKL